jgi:hypothetical protein
VGCSGTVDPAKPAERRNAVGALPKYRLKQRLNAYREENPQASAMADTESPEDARSRAASFNLTFRI